MITTNHTATLTRVLQLRAAKKPLVQAMEALHATAQAKGRDLDAAEQVRFDALASRARAVEKDLDKALAGAGVAVSNDARISVFENVDADPGRGFKHVGEFAQAVASAPIRRRQGQALDPRLVPLAAAPSTSANEGAGSDGGILVPPGFSNGIFTLSLDEDSLLPLADEMVIEGNNMLLPKDESTPWGNTGPRAFWQAEGTAGTPTKPVIGGAELKLKKLLGLVPATSEVVSDALALSSYLPNKLAASVRWKSNEAILFGASAGTPLGALAGGAVVTVPKDSGQVANTLSAVNLTTMVARLPPGSFPRSVWIINNDVLPALFTLTLGNFPVYVPTGAAVGSFSASPYGTLLGRPVIVSQHAKSFSSQGDVLLLDLSYYQTITKAAGVTMATSMHLYFDADSMAFRITFRMDGQPKISSPIAPANGGNNMSPFLQLGAR